MAPTVKVIQKKNTDFPDYLNFKELRREGLEHIGQLSGKIWTDHNVHDPGVTILETLCYALIDLGYRTQLPMKDLLAVDDNKANTGDSFFTPAEILSCNPTTIMDYRKMLIDIEGVANAWLEKSKTAEVDLHLICGEKNEKTGFFDQAELVCGQGEYNVQLNGLYRVKLQLDDVTPFCKNGIEVEAFQTAVLEQVKKRLHEHRNLCEDFLDIQVLCKEQLAICGEIELADNAQSELVYQQILQHIRAFLLPEVNFYTLQEMLNKDKNIEEIFAGRPYRMESFGFIDTEELEKMPLRKEIHLSDIYQIILKTEGVLSVKDLQIKGFINGQPHSGDTMTDCGEWIFQLGENHLPVLCFDRSCFDFYQKNTWVRLDKDRINERLRVTLSKTKKVKQPIDVLDIALPKGQYRPDLGDYYSIQNELPRVYGIGEGGLADSASDKRKSQALQLKGYLLFFDQLLANYLAQLSNMRQLFSMQPESALNGQAKTTFAQGLNSVPQVEQLVRFYNENYKEQGWTEGQVLAIPALKSEVQIRLGILQQQPHLDADISSIEYSEVYKRQVATASFQREFNQGEYRVEITKDGCGFFFIIHPLQGATVLVGKQRYTDKKATAAAAEEAVFLGSISQNYQAINRHTEMIYSFELIFQPINYLDYLQNLVETKQQYKKRRQQFLDHLLARFSEDFTQYSLLLYGASGPTDTPDVSVLETKAKLLNDYPTISRNRGKAFDYKKSAWNTDNISGLEQRMSGLAGIKDWQRRNLCNFEIHDCGEEFRVEFPDEYGEVFLISKETFNSREVAEKAAASIAKALQNSKNYQTINGVNEEYRYILKHAYGTAISAITFNNEEARDKAMQGAYSLHQVSPTIENIEVARSIWRSELRDAAGTLILQSKAKFSNENKAKESFQTIIDKRAKYVDMRPVGARTKLELKPHPIQKKCYINMAIFEQYVRASQSYFRWQIVNEKGLVLLESSTAFDNQKIANEAAANLLITSTEFQLKNIKTGKKESLQLMNSKGELLAEKTFSTTTIASHAKEQLSEFLFGGTPSNSLFELVGKAYKWQLLDGSENVILESTHRFSKKRQAERAWRDFLKNEASYKSKVGIKSIQFEDKSGVIVAESSNLLKDETNLEKWQKKYQKAIEKKRKPRIEKVKKAYAFRLLKGEELLLRSYQLYSTHVAALQSLRNLLDSPIKFEQTGDAANLNFSFVLKNKQGQYIAESPVNYGEAKERKAAQTKVLKYLKSYRLPVAFVTEYRGEFFINESPVLQTDMTFNLPESAIAAMHEILPLLAEPTAYKPVTRKGKEYFSFAVMNGKINVAVLKQAYSEKLASDRQAKQIQDFFASHTYKMTTRRIADKWQFVYYCKSKNNEIERGLVSAPIYLSEADAEVAYTKFVEGSISARFIEETTKKGTSFQVFLKGEERSIASHPKYYKTLEESIEQQHFLQQKIAFATNIRIGEWSRNRVIVKTPESETGQYVYRILKKDEPIAFFPCHCYGDKELEALQQKQDELCQRMVTDYGYFNLCLSSEAVCQINGKWHFVIREEKSDTIFFVSWKNYGSYQEAYEAFLDNYLIIIDLASDLVNYGSAISLSLPPESQAEVCMDKNSAIAYVPVEIIEKYSKEELTQMACSYPIRTIEIDSPKEDCDTAKTRKYYFHLVRPDATLDEECKVDWCSTKCYETVAEAREGFKHFLHLLPNKCNLRKDFQDPTGQLHHWRNLKWYSEANLKNANTENEIDVCCNFLTINEVLLESKKRFANEAAAWLEIRDLLVNVDENEAFFTMQDEEECCYTFCVAKKDYQVAKHTMQYHTKVALNDAKNKLKKSCSEKEFKDLKIECVSAENGQYYFEIKEEDMIVWKSIPTYSSIEMTEQKAYELLAFARDEAYYYLGETSIKISSKINGEVNEMDNFLAEHLADFPKEYLIQLGQQYPYTFTENGYGFQLFCEHLNQTAWDSTQPCGCIEEPHDSIEIQGVYAWQSCRAYATLDEAQDAFANFCELIKDNENWHETQTDDCSQFSLEIIDSSKFIAVHPQCYTYLADLEEARKRVVECMDNEGFHLIEHILLRPQKETDCSNGKEQTCLLPILPDCDCKLCIPLDESDFCERGVTNNVSEETSCCGENAVEYIPGSDPYSFWATVVLPEWPTRFRTHRFRTYLQNLWRSEAPAHIGLRIVWLEPEQLCKFEKNYKDWLNWKIDETICEELNMPCDFVNCLADLRDQAPVFEEETADNCICEAPQKAENESPVNEEEYQEANTPIRIDSLNWSINYTFSRNRDLALPDFYIQEIFGSPTPYFQWNDSISELSFNWGNYDFGRDLRGIKTLDKSSKPEALDTAKNQVLNIKKEEEIDVKSKPLVPTKKVSTKIEKTFTENEIRKGIADRKLQYLTNIELISNNQLRATKSYEMAHFFIRTGGNIQAYERLVTHIIRYSLGRKGGADEEQYLVLLRNATWDLLDRFVSLKNRDELLEKEQLMICFAKLKANKMDMSLLAKNWQGKELKNWLKAKAVVKYERLMKA